MKSHRLRLPYSYSDDLGVDGCACFAIYFKNQKGAAAFKTMLEDFSDQAVNYIQWPRKAKKRDHKKD